MLDNLDRFVDPNFIPSDEDILKTRYRTTQISETKFHIDNLIYRIYDVGGQRSLRLVWAPYFEGEIHAIQFIVSLASYDQQLVEAKNENRMIDSIELFKSICDNKLLEGVNFILFLNKIDLFERKILTSPIKDYFSDFEETNDDSKKLKNACRYFKNKFLCCNSQTERKIYTHFTCGTDTALMKVTINAVRDIVTRLALQASGIY
ncbi:hypothetical protein HDU92_001876 [Lobulomyces angularis]|nr:hypothetical protein HDU92_001876 [Lobulomyces angularis]